MPFVHGLYKHPLYRRWTSIRARCRDPNRNDYPYYGGRGIKVCRRWDDFENFIADMGDPPSPEHQVDRRDNNGDYDPSNCYWATRSQQQRNCRPRPSKHSEKVLRLYATGKYSQNGLARLLGISPGYVNKIVTRKPSVREVRK